MKNRSKQKSPQLSIFEQERRAEFKAEVLTIFSTRKNLDKVLIETKFQTTYRSARYYPVIETNERFCICRMVDNFGQETIFDPPVFYGNVRG